MYVTSLAAPNSLQRLVGRIPSALQLPLRLKRVSETLLLPSCTAWHAACYVAAADPVHWQARPQLHRAASTAACHLAPTPQLGCSCAANQQLRMTLSNGIAQPPSSLLPDKCFLPSCCS